MPTDLTILERLEPISIDEMDAIRLMNRIDTKFLTDSQTLGVILEKAAGKGYRVFEVEGLRINEYRSMYYDTPELQMYLDHHNRRLVRQKLRTRCYVSTGQTFLEIKSKNNHGRTKKKRMEIGAAEYRGELLASGAIAPWLEERMQYSLEGIAPALETVFSRITLVNREKTERSTIDFGVRFGNARNGASADLGDLVIIEVKQDGNLPSALRDILLECRVKPVRISKYCIGTALTDSDVRRGRFKPKLILINKLKEQI